jgi:hypothetical protein
MTPEQQDEFEKAVQQHIQLAVNAALANMPQQPPQPNTPDAYEQLKARLTDSYAKTRWQQVFALIDLPALGDRRSSHLMNEMLALLPTGSNKDDSLFLGLFLRKLPTTMRDHLAAADHQTATSMAKYADVLWNARCSKAAVATVDASEIDAVKRAKNASRSSRSPDSRRSPNRRGQSSQHRKPTSGLDSRRRDPALCFYHNKWGNKAQKCQAPYSWTEN